MPGGSTAKARERGAEWHRRIKAGPGPEARKKRVAAIAAEIDDFLAGRPVGFEMTLTDDFSYGASPPPSPEVKQAMLSFLGSATVEDILALVAEERGRRTDPPPKVDICGSTTNVRSTVYQGPWHRLL